MSSTINILVRHSIYVGAQFKEALDLALVCAAFEHQVNLIFLENGVYALQKDQQSQVIGEKNQTDLLKGLSFYDIDNIFLENDSMKERGLSDKDLLIDAKLIDSQTLKQMNRTANQVVVI